MTSIENVSNYNQQCPIFIFAKFHEFSSLGVDYHRNQPILNKGVFSYTSQYKMEMVANKLNDNTKSILSTWSLKYIYSSPGSI